jgi:predicted transcriptional regulator
MENYIKRLIKDFKGKDFKDFIQYVYITFDGEVSSTKKKQDKNKYIKIRQSVLEYIIAKERAISIELSKKSK